MIPRSKAPGSRMTSRTALLAFMGVLLVLIAAQVAGMAFMLVLGAPATSATPFTVPQYAAYYWGAAQVQTALWVGIGAGLLVIASPVLLLIDTSRTGKLHGAARWASGNEIRKAGMLGSSGIIVGEHNGKILHHEGTDRVSPHVFLAAPTGSGKTQGVMLPNALNWPGSLVVLDIKSELFNRTAGFRKEAGQQIVRLDFAPPDLRSEQYNPFAYVSDVPELRAGDIRRIADYLIVDSKADTFWSDNARQIFTACALYFYGIHQLPTLPKIRALIDIKEGFIPWCKKFVADEGSKVHHPVCLSGFARVAHGAENTIMGVMASVTQALSPLTNDLTGAVLSGNTFDLRQLRTKRMSIYLTANTKDREQYGPLMRLFFQQLIDLNMSKEFAELGPQAMEVLLGMDEFASLGKLPAVANSITVIRSYGLRLLAIVQSPAQLVSLYGREEARTLTDNFGCAISFTPGPGDFEAAEELSRVLGNTTVRSQSESRRKHALLESHASISNSEQKRPLMLPQEIMQMHKNDCIIRVSAMPPIRANKLVAAENPIFKSRTGKPVQTPQVPIEQRWQPPPAPGAMTWSTVIPDWVPPKPPAPKPESTDTMAVDGQLGEPPKRRSRPELAAAVSDEVAKHLAANRSAEHDGHSQADTDAQDDCAQPVDDPLSERKPVPDVDTPATAPTEAQDQPAGIDPKREDDLLADEPDSGGFVRAGRMELTNHDSARPQDYNVQIPQASLGQLALALNANEATDFGNGDAIANFDDFQLVSDKWPLESAKLAVNEMMASLTDLPQEADVRGEPNASQAPASRAKPYKSKGRQNKAKGKARARG